MDSACLRLIRVANVLGFAVPSRDVAPVSYLWYDMDSAVSERNGGVGRGASVRRCMTMACLEEP